VIAVLNQLSTRERKAGPTGMAEARSMKPGNADGGRGPQLRAEGSMSGVWKRQHGDASEAPTTERVGNR